MNLQVLRSARRTAAEGIRFYEPQEAGLGAYFFSSIMSDICFCGSSFGSRE